MFVFAVAIPAIVSSLCVLSRSRRLSLPCFCRDPSNCLSLVHVWFGRIGTLHHSRGASLPLKGSFLLSSTLYWSRTSSSILSAKFFQVWSISLWLRPLHFFISSVSSSTASIDHPDTFFFSLNPFTPVPYDMQSCTYSSCKFCMTSSCKELDSLLLRSKISSNAIWSPSCHLSSSSSFSICEQSQLRMTLCSIGLKDKTCLYCRS